MRALRFANLAILSALVATSAALYAQDEKQDEKPARQEQPRAEPRQQEQPRPETRQDEMKPPRQNEAKPPKQEKQDQKQEQKMEDKRSHEQMRPAQQEPARPEARNQGNGRPQGRGGHIPDDRFRAQFGRSHSFRAQRPVIVEGQPRFQYGGYNFVLVDPWPEDWAYTDDCYVDYIDGDYFLFDLLHPGERIALFVVM